VSTLKPFERLASLAASNSLTQPLNRRRRENGDGRADHRHMGRSLNNGNGTPLHVSGMTSDANHRSSWYHTLKSKCSMSGSCPKKGCYDCPHFSEKGANPYFKAKNEIMEEKRLEELMETLGKEMRKRMEL
jgi:hypothetical protein